MKSTVYFWLNEDDNEAQIFEDIIKGDLPLCLLEGDTGEDIDRPGTKRKFELTLSMNQV